VASQELHETIELYLAGLLEGEQLSNFEQRLAEDAELRQEVELHRQLESAIVGQKKAAEFGELLKNIDQEHFTSDQEQTIKSEAKVRRLIPSTVLRIAAVLAIFAAVGIWLSRGPGMESSANKLFDSGTVPSSVRSNLNEEQRILQEAYEAYEAANWLEAVSLFDSYQSLAEQASSASHFFEGNAYYELKDYANAGDAYSIVLEQKDSRWFEQARENMIASLIQQKQYQEALDLIDQIDSVKLDQQISKLKKQLQKQIQD
jgi:tetratricopeptide (TPR) repeat protein